MSASRGRLAHARPFTALATAALALVLAHPLTTLVTGDRWWPTLVTAAAGVALAGVILRGLLRPTSGWARLGVVVLQLLLVVVVIARECAPATLLGDLVPTPGTVPALVRAARVGALTLTTEPPVVPVSIGVTALVAGAASLIALSMDGLSATARRSGAAGLPALVLFAAVVGNLLRSQPASWFASAAALYLLMLLLDGLDRVQAWPTRAVRRTTHRATRAGWSAALARGVAVCAAALVAALALPTVIPVLDTRVVGDGLGRLGGSTTTGRFVETMDLAQDLGDRSSTVVLRYRTDDVSPPPLRVATTSRYADGRWRPGGTDAAQGEPVGTARSTGVPSDLDSLRGDVPTVDYTAQVEQNDLAPPHLAVPGRPRSLSLPVGWRHDPSTDTIRVDGQPDSYTVVFTEIAPGATLPEGIGTREGYARYRAGSPELAPPDDEAAARRVTRFADEVVPDGASALAAAVAIQDRLRSGPDFRYSLELETPSDPGLDPLSAFLETRTGYCVQFASLMVFMARSQGIPARMAVGYLPGDGAGALREVRPRDAHTWPEIYLDGLGWTRFEPTPSSRTGAAPDYATPEAVQRAETPQPTASATTAAPTPDDEPTTARSTRAPEDDITNPDTAVAADEAGSGRWLVWLGALALLTCVAAGLAAVPTLLARQRRTRLSATLPPGEAAWQTAVLDITDREGPAPTGLTPRGWAARVLDALLGRISGASADSRQRARVALEVLVASVERERYGPPGADPVDQRSLDEARRTLLAEVDAVRSSSERRRTRLIPRSARLR